MKIEKVIVITGASSGIGYALAKKFKYENFTVVNISRSICDIADINIKADLSNPDDISNAVGNLMSKVERVDILVNNAGVGLYESWENLTTVKFSYLNFFARA
jgi:short-subunit dehydrogenase